MELWAEAMPKVGQMIMRQIVELVHHLLDVLVVSHPHLLILVEIEPQPYHLKKVEVQILLLAQVLELPLELEECLGLEDKEQKVIYWENLNHH